MRPRTRRLYWLLIIVLALLLIAGTLAARASSSATTALLRLVPGESITVSVFRLFPGAVHVSLDFSRSKGALRPELGSFTTRQGANYIEFESPGAPVIVQVEGAALAAVHEALPAGAYGAEHIGRDLVVRDLDGNPSRFRWPPDNASRPVLPSGRSTVRISVLEVGAPLMGEQVTAVVNAPLSFKSASPGYGFLWWFFFWPVLAALLVIYTAVLLWLSLRPSHSPTNRDEP